LLKNPKNLFPYFLTFTFSHKFLGLAENKRENFPRLQKTWQPTFAQRPKCRHKVFQHIKLCPISQLVQENQSGILGLRCCLPRRARHERVEKCLRFFFPIRATFRREIADKENKENKRNTYTRQSYILFISAIIH